MEGTGTSQAKLVMKDGQKNLWLLNMRMLFANVIYNHRDFSPVISIPIPKALFARISYMNFPYLLYRASQNASASCAPLCMLPTPNPRIIPASPMREP
jgi:hypothetical protein